MAHGIGNVRLPRLRPSDNVVGTWGGHVVTGIAEDMALVRQVVDGDAGAFQKIYASYYPKVFAIAKGVLLDADDAADTTQEVFM